MRILVTYAVPQELIEVKFKGIVRDNEEVEVGYIRTGIGKMKSAYHLSKIIDVSQPDLVINMGSAGSLRHKVGDILVCSKFIDRDMIALKDLGVDYAIDTRPLLRDKGFCLEWNFESICSTGDSFETQCSNIEADVVDMEAFAQAWVCNLKGVPFVSVKCVTDIIGENSIDVWEKRLEMARIKLSDFFENKGGIL